MFYNSVFRNMDKKVRLKKLTKQVILKQHLYTRYTLWTFLTHQRLRFQKSICSPISMSSCLQALIISIWNKSSTIHSSYNSHFLNILYGIKILQQNSINRTCMGLDMYQIIEYSRLSDNTYPDLSSHR